MTERYRFFDNVSYTEADQAEVQNRFRAEGVLWSIGNKLAIGAPGSMFVSVATGEAFVEGFWYSNDAAFNLPIGNNTSGSTRIDRIVLRLNRTANTLTAFVIVGTPGAGTPALTQIVGGTWDFPLATITVTNGLAAVLVGNIADNRVFSSSQVQLDFTAITDIGAGVAMASDTWVNLHTNMTFFVDSLNSIVEISASAAVQVLTASGSGVSASRFIIDSAGTPILKRLGMGVASNTIAGNPFAGAGSIFLHGSSALSVGSHTIAAQCLCQATATMYCRAAAVPNYEAYSLRIIEHKRM